MRVFGFISKKERPSPGIYTGYTLMPDPICSLHGNHAPINTIVFIVLNAKYSNKQDCMITLNKYF